MFQNCLFDSEIFEDQFYRISCVTESVHNKYEHAILDLSSETNFGHLLYECFMSSCDKPSLSILHISKCFENYIYSCVSSYLKSFELDFDCYVFKLNLHGL